jgi:hypothetical protein
MTSVVIEAFQWGCRHSNRGGNMRYWLSINDGKTYGPYDLTQLKSLVAKGRVNASAMLCPEGSMTWGAAPTVVPQLFASQAEVAPEPIWPPAPTPAPAAAPAAGATPPSKAEVEHGTDANHRSTTASASGGNTGGGGNNHGRGGFGNGNSDDDARRSRNSDTRDADDPTKPTFFLARLVDALIEWLAGIARGGIFGRVSVATWNAGHFAFLGGAIALLAFVIVFAVRLDSLSIAASALGVPIAAAIGQYMALRFAPTNELIVRNSPLRASSETLFQLLGVVMLMVATLAAAAGVYSAVKQGEVVEIVAPTLAAGVFATIGFLFLSPQSLSLNVDNTATAGEDGLALVGTLIKALLASSRFIFGLYAVAGGTAAVVGTIWFLADAQELRAPLLASVGAALLGLSAVFPLYAYITAILYFVFVDAIKGLVSLSRASNNSANQT